MTWLTAASLLGLVLLAVLPGAIREAQARRRRREYLRQVARLAAGLNAVQAVIGTALLPAIKASIEAFAAFEAAMREVQDLTQMEWPS